MDLSEVESNIITKFSNLSKNGRQKIMKLIHKEYEKENNREIIDNICCATRSDGTQCSRKKKNGDYCGTHSKLSDNNSNNALSDPLEKSNKSLTTRKEIWTHEFNGIIQYIDADFNVYKHEDIMNNTINPKIIHKYKILDDGKYVIV